MRLLPAFCIFAAFSAIVVVECKRGGGTRGGGGSRSTGWGLFNRKSSSKKTSSTGTQTHAVGPPAGAPPAYEPSLNKQTAQTQHTSNGGQQKPYGWNVPGTNQHGQPGNWGGGYGQAGHHATHTGGSYAQGPPSYQQSFGHAHSPSGYQGFGQRQAPPSYQQSFGHQPYGGYHQPGYGGYGGYGGGHHGYGGYHPGGYGGYGGGGYGYNPMGGFGGGWGGGMSPYGYKKRSFFSGSTFGNILTGMMIYHLTSSLVGGMFRRPYSVYNYYNMPPEAKQEIKMPSNILTLCEGNTTNFCAQGTTSICTTNGTVLCVATMTKAVPCAEEKTLCVNATMSCPDKNDPVCLNVTKGEENATLPVPCLTNLTVDVNLLNEANKDNHDYKYCVTQMAVAGPEYRNCTAKDLQGTAVDYRSVIDGNYNWNLTVTKMVYPYTIYNYFHPTQSSNGEIVMPLSVVIPCIENATRLCAPGLVPFCTELKEVMCLETLTETKYCEQYNTTCTKSHVECKEDIQSDPLCKDKTEEELSEKDGKKVVEVYIPCFANITVNSYLPNFEIHEFNGTLPEGQHTSYTYHYRYCVGTLGMPGPESDACLLL